MIIFCRKMVFLLIFGIEKAVFLQVFILSFSDLWNFFVLYFYY